MTGPHPQDAAHAPLAQLWKVSWDGPFQGDHRTGNFRICPDF